MQEKLKYRLIGLFVIVLSAGILFPLFFNGDGYRERHLESAIPEVPLLPEVVAIEPQSITLPDTSEVAAPEEPRPVVKKSAELVKKIERKKPVINVDEDKPVLDKQGVPVAWTLQLATFSDEGNANELRTQLIGAGHKVYTRQNGTLVKVYVGPDFQRSNLESLKTRLKKDLNLDGIIVRFSTR
ncbi:MAG: SPOR domain-containing protein [Oceanospirillaceae bacterium]|nr:SPOR domain-containing protein [Oceanospirillaceae bacterium]